MFYTMKEIKNIAECMPGYTLVYKIGNKIKQIFYSENLHGFLGYEKEEFNKIFMDPMSLVFSEDYESVKNKIDVVVKQHEKIDLSFRFVHKSGKPIWVRLYGNYIGEMDNDALYLTSIYNESDEWETKDVIIDSSDRGVVVFDKDTKLVLYGNKKFFKFANTTKENCLGGFCYDVVCKAGVFDKNQCICFKAIGRTEPLVSYNPITDSYYEITASEIMWGEHSAIIFFMSDITAETKKDQEIIEKNEKLNQIQKEAIRNYKKQLEIITDGNSDLLSTCRFNLTKNICIPGTCRTEFMRKLQNEGTADGYFRLGLEQMDKKDIQKLKYPPSVSYLLEAFNNGVERLSDDAYFEVETHKTLYVRTTIHMAKNPITQDVEAILYTRDLTGIKLQNDILRCLMEEQYESISIINLNSRKVSVVSYNYDGFAGTQYEGEDYDVCMKYFMDTYVMEEEREEYSKHAGLEYISEKLARKGKYAFMFHFQQDKSEIRLKTIEYYYSDERHNTIIGATRDITEVTRQQTKNMNDLKEALLRADKATEAKSAFFSNISHDMRTPLNGILGFSGLGKEAHTIEESKEYFSKIQSSGKFLLKLINDTLDISKIESGQMKLKQKKVNLHELLQESVNSVEETARIKDITLQVECPKNHEKYVSADRLRLEQLLTNLLGNAIKFTPSGGTVKFLVKELDEEENYCNYKIIIEDNGVGMKKEFLPHAFEAYSQDDSNAKMKAMGTGLGLAIVKQIVSLMRGTIKLDSEEGKGTRFDIWLPLQLVRMDEKKQEVEIQNVDLYGKKILLCEDHPINRELACRLLERKGIKIICAENGKIGVQTFSESKIGEFDAILMDIRMPEMNGLEAAEAIRRLDREDARRIPIIAMTANAYESDKKASIRFGMNAHIPKPIDPKILYQTLNEYINANGQEFEITKNEKWKPKVIVVDDVEVNIAVIKAAIEEKYIVFEASDGKHALNILEKEAGIAAVITDIQMPNMDGIELIKKIRSDSDYDNIAILANTQHEEYSQEEELLAIGADDFIYKPTISPIILARLNNVVRKYK